MHVFLQEGSCWAQSIQTEFYNDLTGFDLDADVVCRAREKEMKYLVGSLKICSLPSRAVALTDIDGWRQTDPRSVGRHQQGLSRLSGIPIEGGGGGDEVPVGNRPQDKAVVSARTMPLEVDHLLCFLALRTGAPTRTSARHADVVMVFLGTRRELPHVEMARTLRNCQRNRLTVKRTVMVNCLVISLACATQVGTLEWKVEETCVAGGAGRGLQHPCSAFKPGSKAPHRISTLHHGDDFLLVGTCSDVKEISSFFIIKARGILGPWRDDFESISMIHRVVRWVDETTKRREYAAGPWHREVLLVELGLYSALGATTPFEKS